MCQTTDRLRVDLLKRRSYAARAPDLKSTRCVLPRRFKIAQKVVRSCPQRRRLLSLAKSHSAPAPASKVVWQAASLHSACQRRGNSATDPSVPHTGAADD